MLDYDKIDVSEGIDVNKTNVGESNISNGCYNLMQKFINFNDVAIVSVKGSN